ncbi:hypothetical protein PISMIDRAFT_296273 [Pisolithus microcarpus 441]|uniref:Uncharacterized protein n=1 Tax=Pisolithus microcarpus 441 TaxID=765257 RepID=A0A0D0A7S2_9AGAM|nr:hypothetical protein PISMIDRAFT_296273 [Pisolithus microcarpus 441]
MQACVGSSSMLCWRFLQLIAHSVECDRVGIAISLPDRLTAPSPLAWKSCVPDHLLKKEDRSK